MSPRIGGTKSLGKSKADRRSSSDGSLDVREKLNTYSQKYGVNMARRRYSKKERSYTHCGACSREQGLQCAAYGVLMISAWLPTVKYNTKTEMQMCQSIVSKAKER